MQGSELTWLVVGIGLGVVLSMLVLGVIAVMDGLALRRHEADSRAADTPVEAHRPSPRQPPPKRSRLPAGLKALAVEEPLKPLPLNLSPEPVRPKEVEVAELLEEMPEPIVVEAPPVTTAVTSPPQVAEAAEAPPPEQEPEATDEPPPPLVEVDVPAKPATSTFVPLPKPPKVAWPRVTKSPPPPPAITLPPSDDKEIDVDQLLADILNSEDKK